MNLKANGIEMDDELLWIDVVGGEWMKNKSLVFACSVEKKKKEPKFDFQKLFICAWVLIP